MYLQYRKLKLIKISDVLDKYNERILNGLLDTFDKEYTRDDRLKIIFPNWEVGDILVIADNPLKYPKLQGDRLVEMPLYEAYQNGLYELQFNEVIYKDDVLTLEAGQYVDESGVLQTVPKIEGVRVEWDWVNHVWEDKATNLEVVEAQYKEYEVMNDPLTLKEMEMQDPNLLTEYYNMMLELKKLIYALKESETQPVGYTAIQLPKPSSALEAFKNRFNKFF